MPHVIEADIQKVRDKALHDGLDALLDREHDLLMHDYFATRIEDTCRDTITEACGSRNRRRNPLREHGITATIAGSIGISIGFLRDIIALIS